MTMLTNAIARACLDLQTIGQGLARAEVDEIGVITRNGIQQVGLKIQISKTLTLMLELDQS